MRQSCSILRVNKILARPRFVIRFIFIFLNIKFTVKDIKEHPGVGIGITEIFATRLGIQACK